MPHALVKEFKGSVVGGLDPPGNSILGKAVEGVCATNPLLIGVIDEIEAPLKILVGQAILSPAVVLLQSVR